jgi:hypothetical protein
MAGGKMAAERRKLKRLKELKTAGGEEAKGAAAEIKIMNIIKKKEQGNRNTETADNHNNFHTRKGGPNVNAQEGGQRQGDHSNGNGKRTHRLSDVSATRKKPKHLKRKLEQLATAAEQDSEKAAELEKLKVEMKDLEEQKKKRNFVFETKIQAAAGDAFDKVRM